MCKHNFKYWGRGGNDMVYFRCTKCNEEKTRPFTQAEKYMYKKDILAYRMEQKYDNVNLIYRNFMKNFDPDINKMRGYDLMNAVRKWAAKFPTVDIISCDDDYHMGSIIVFIPHENSKEYWGTTMISISQNGKEPSVMFLYPGHAEEMLKTLRKINKLQKNNDLCSRMKLTPL